MIVKDLFEGVKSKLRNRDDLDQRIPVYIQNAIYDLSENYKFEELSVPGPVTNFVLDQCEYLVNKNPFIVDTDVRLTFVNSWFVWFTNSTPTLGVDTGFEIKFRNLRVVEPMSKISGIPTFFTKEGNLLIVGYLPDQTYACQMRYQRQHPFPILGSDPVQNAALLNQAKVFMPRDWKEIIEYAAAAKGADDVGMPEIGSLYFQRIYGYKDKFGNETPGIIQARMSAQQRLGQFNEKQLRVSVRRYCK